MLNTLESRLADLLADALVGADNLGTVGRRGAAGPPSAGTIGIEVCVSDFGPQSHVGDDKRLELRQDGEIRLRPTLHLIGTTQIRLVANAPNGPTASQARERLITILDRILLALAPQAVRTGQAFSTDDDQGFELDHFRLKGAGSPSEAGTDEPLRIDLTYGFEGRFWPVQEFPAGDLITSLPTRLTIMPVRLPAAISVRAGGSDIVVPIRLTMSVANGAASALVARLEGAAPPGVLVGDGTPAPTGFTGFAIDSDGNASLIYQPPDVLAGPAFVRVETRLAHPDAPSIGLTRFEIEVVPA